MKASLMSAVLGAATFVAAAASDVKTVDVYTRLMTWNIRLAVGVPGAGEELWSKRRPGMRAALNYEVAGRPEALLCFQEVLNSQRLDLAEDLAPLGYKHVGVGRDDGAFKGEFSPIFYRSDAWDLEQNRTYWLSETPDVPSKGWDAALPRIVTVAQFRHKKTAAPFIYMCTHFDHVGEQARVEAGRLISKIAAEWSEKSTEGGRKTPVFLGGDLNVTPDNQAYKELIAPGNMFDVKHIVPKELHHGNKMTYTGFNLPADKFTEIDHIFVKDPSVVKLESFAVLPTWFDDKLYISDHRPVVVDVVFKSNKICKARN